MLVTAFFVDLDPLPTGNWPVTVPFQTTVSQVVSATSAIKNDGSVAGTSLIEATVSGDSSSAVTLTNDAVMVLGDSAHPGSLTMAGLLTMNDTATLAGATSGSLTVHILCAFPIVLVGKYSNFKNGGATDQFLTLPVAFNGGLALIITGDDVPGYAFAAGSAKGGCGQVLTGLSASGGTLSNTSSGYQQSNQIAYINITNSIRTLISGGALNAGFNQIEQSSGNISGHNGWFVIIGA